MVQRSEVRTSAGMTIAVAEPDAAPRATLYALHGGGMNGAYWDCPHDPSSSLVRLGTSLGLRVVTPDRPGHRANRAGWPDGLLAGDEAALHAAAVGELWPDDPVVLVGHSAGAIVALHVAALHPWAGLAGVDYSGIGIRLGAPPGAEVTREWFWGPPELTPPAALAPGTRPTEPSTASDGESARAWQDAFPTVAGRITVPVRYTVADHERWWDPVDRLVAAVPGAFTASPAVSAEVAYGAGHNLSLGHAARAYHLRVLAFADDCLRRAERA